MVALGAPGGRRRRLTVMPGLYGILDRPWVYRLSQFLLAPGAGFMVARRFARLLAEVPPAPRMLDVGCGPASWLSRFGLRPAGLDHSLPYIAQYRIAGGEGVVGSSDALPFSSASFDSVWTMGLLHHLPDAAAARTIREMGRVCKPAGSVVVMDAVMPRGAWRRPIAYCLRRLDRGGFVRTEEQMSALLERNAPAARRMERFTYTLFGHELLVCRFGGAPPTP